MKKLINTLQRTTRWLFPRRNLFFAVAVVLAVGAAVLTRSTTAAQGVIVQSLPNVVLVHGAWADGSSWNAVIARLQKEGYHVTAVQIPLTTLADDVARVRTVLAAQSGPTILVGHSFGGAVISKLGSDAPHVAGLVYVAAFAPAEGESMKDLISSGPQPASAAAIRPDAQGFISLDPAGFVQFFAPDVDPTQARVLAAVQKPIAASEFLSEEKFGLPTWKTVPSWYLVTEDDQMIPPPAQQFMAQRMGATVSSIKSSHVPMLSHPDVVANLIQTAAQAVSGGGAPTIQEATPEPRPQVIVGPDSLTFAPTGKTVRGAFRTYWDAHGGLPIFGYPISDELTEQSATDGKPYTVQYFERAVFELHPENQAPYDVLLTRLGSLRYDNLYGSK